jgi:hypothetical protein
MKEKNYPKYVFLNGTALRYREDSGEYWCDNGHWGVGIVKGVDMVCPYTFERKQILVSKSHVSYVNNRRLLPCTEAEWVKSVGPYIPSDYKLEIKTLAESCVRLDEGWDFLDNEENNERLDVLSITDYKYLLIRR